MFRWSCKMSHLTLLLDISGLSFESRSRIPLLENWDGVIMDAIICSVGHIEYSLGLAEVWCLVVWLGTVLWRNVMTERSCKPGPYPGSDGSTPNPGLELMEDYRDGLQLNYFSSFPTTNKQTIPSASVSGFIWVLESDLGMAVQLMTLYND